MLKSLRNTQQLGTDPTFWNAVNSLQADLSRRISIHINTATCYVLHALTKVLSKPCILLSSHKGTSLPVTIIVVSVAIIVVFVVFIIVVFVVFPPIKFGWTQNLIPLLGSERIAARKAADFLKPLVGVPLIVLEYKHNSLIGLPSRLGGFC